MLERERKIAIRLLITGSGVRVPHNPLKESTILVAICHTKCVHLQQMMLLLLH
jgi:hypothetical protein